MACWFKDITSKQEDLFKENLAKNDTVDFKLKAKTNEGTDVEFGGKQEYFEQGVGVG